MDDRSEELMLVRNVRNAIDGVGKDVAASTVEDYKKLYGRMLATGTNPENARSKADFYRKRAALLYVSAEQARQALRVRDKSAYGSADWKHVVAELGRLATIFERYPPDTDRIHQAVGSTGITWREVLASVPGLTTKNGSKRIGLGALLRRPGWKDRLMEHVDPRYRDALAVSLLTGIRPAEIAQGVVVRQHPGGLEIVIRGAKLGPSRGHL